MLAVGAFQYSLSIPLNKSLAVTVNALFVYLPVVETDAPLIVGLFLSTIKLNVTFVLASPIIPE